MDKGTGFGVDIHAGTYIFYVYIYIINIKHWKTYL